MYVGDKGLTLHASTDALNGTGISYKSSDKKIATVDQNGKVTGKKIGTAIITAYTTVYVGDSEFNLSAQCKVKVLKKPGKVGISCSSTELMLGETGYISPKFSSGYGSTCSFYSYNPEVAEIDEFGHFSAKGTGTAKLKLKTYNGKSATCTITVYAPSESLTLSKDGLSMGVGMSETLTPCFQEFEKDQCIFFSQDESIATVSEQGKVTAVSPGQTVISCVTQTNNITALCYVNVSKAPESIALQKKLSIGKGDKIQLTDLVTLDPLDSVASFKLSTSNANVVKVYSDGRIKGVNAGRATVTVSTHNGLKKSITVTVYNRPSKITASLSASTLGAGMCGKISVSFPKNTYAIYTITSDSDLLSVGSGGTLTCSTSVSEPTVARITVRTNYGNLAKTLKITLLPGPTSLELDTKEFLCVGQSVKLSPALVPEDTYSSLSYSSSAPDIAYISSSGTLKGMGCGNAVITVSTANGVSFEYEVQVIPYSKEHTAFCIAHRGGGSGIYPENSIAAFEHSESLGASMVELDVWRSKDGVLFVRHDRKIKYKGKSVNASSLSWALLKKLDPNICTLASALKVMKPFSLQIQIEIKASGYEKAVLTTVKDAGLLSHTCYGSFNLNVINKIKSLYKKATTVYILADSSVLKKICASPSSYSCSAVSLSHGLATEQVVRDLHLGNKQVYAWTVNDPSEMQRLIEIGVDGVCTDYPATFTGGIS